jgi:hypothetical protein
MLQATKSQGTNVVFMHFAVNIGDEWSIKANSIAELTDEQDQWEEIIACRA